MSRQNYIFTSESVSEGHPDKVADRISDVVVDAFLAEEPEARVACETLVTTNRIVLAGEIRAAKPGASKAENKERNKAIIASLEPKVRAAVKDIGYAQKGFHWEKAKYQCFLHAQSDHIAQGVDAGEPLVVEVVRQAVDHFLHDPEAIGHRRGADLHEPLRRARVVARSAVFALQGRRGGRDAGDLRGAVAVRGSL